MRQEQAGRDFSKNNEVEIKTKVETLPASDDAFDSNKESEISLVKDFKFVKDYKLSPEGAGQHELLAEAVARLVNKIKEGEYKSVVFLDKSGRPLATMLRDMWPYDFDETGEMTSTKPSNEKMPTINFLNVGTETTDAIDTYFTNHPEILTAKAKEKYQKELNTVIQALEDYQKTLSQNSLEFHRVKGRLADIAKAREVFSQFPKRLINQVNLAQNDITQQETRNKFTDLNQWEEVEKKLELRNGYFPPGYLDDSYHNKLLSLIDSGMIKDALGEEKIKKLTESYALFKNEGKVLIVDEYSLTGQSREFAKKIIQSGLDSQNKKIDVDIYSLSDEMSGLFKESSGSWNPPWRASMSHPERKGITGVVDPKEGELTAKAYYKESPGATKDVIQLRGELHTIARKYLVDQKSKLDKETINTLTTKLQSAG